MIFITAVLRVLICNLDRCLAVPENQPPTMLRLLKLRCAGFVFAPKRVQEALPSFPGQSHCNKAEEISRHSEDIFVSYDPVKKGCL